MKKILITLEYPPQYGGVATYLEGLVSQMEQDSVVVLTAKHPLAYTYDQNQKIKIIRKELFYKFTWPRWAKAYFESYKIIFQEKIDHVIVSHLLPMGYVAMLLKKPYTVIAHGMDILAARQNFWKKYWARKILLNAVNIIVNSQFTKSGVAKLGIDESKITIVYPCPNQELFNVTINEKKLEEIKIKNNLNNKKILLSVCRLVERKGCDKVIESLKILKKTYSNLRYLIIGNGPDQKRLQNLIDKLDLKNEITILNNIPFQDLAYFYNIADIFMMVSRQIGNDVEGFGLTALEAALFGKPAIGGDSGGVPEAILNNKTGLIINPLNVDDISAAITKVFTDPYLKINLGLAAKNRAFNEFNWDKQFSKIKPILS